MFESSHRPAGSAQAGSVRVNVVPRWAGAIRWAAAIVFIVFGAGKFVDHASELASFRHYGLLAPGAFAYAIGVLEIAGGVLLAGRVLVRAAAMALAIDMVGAIVVAGIGEGELLSVTLAPALLLALIVVLRAGPTNPSPGRPVVSRLRGHRGRDGV